MTAHRVALLLSALALGPGACSDDGASGLPDAGSPLVDAASDQDAGPQPKPVAVYLTLAAQLGESRDLWTCEAWPSLRTRFLHLVDEVDGRGLTMSVLVGMPFLQALQNCETEEQRNETGGRNLLAHLASDRGLEIVAWVPGGWDRDLDWSYADVASLVKELTGAAPTVAGAVAWQDSEQVTALFEGTKGRRTPDYIWKPEVLTCAYGEGHLAGDTSQDDRTSGVWSPAGSEGDFFTHDAEGKSVYVAPGWWETDWQGTGTALFTSPAQYARLLVRYQLRGEIPVGQTYTVTWILPEAVTTDEGLERDVFLARLDELSDLVSSGQVVVAPFRHVADLWLGPYHRRPCQLPIDQVDPSDLPPGS